MIQLGDLIFSQAPISMTKTPLKLGERRARSINKNMIKSGTPAIKMMFSLSGVVKTDFDALLAQFSSSGFLPFLPGELMPEFPGIEYIVSFNSFTAEQEGAAAETYTIELEEK